MKAPEVVLDASVAIPLSLELPEFANAVGTLDAAELVLAPSLFLVEVANAVATLARAGRIGKGSERAVWGNAAALISRFTPDEELVEGAFAMALETKHPIYDCLYAELARRHRCPVLTDDRRLRRLLAQLGISIANPR